MQRRTFLNTTLGAAVLALTGCGGGDSTVAATPASTDATSATATAALSTQLDALPPSDLSATEASALVFMREEEKLARDVYQ
ncbi:MAG: ferritin, partial [Thiomonas arsenitoxydans]|nr:ferritin [Thiomonas arsenitoxydans]